MQSLTKTCLPSREQGVLRGAQPLTKTYLPSREQEVLRGAQPLLEDYYYPLFLEEEGRVMVKKQNKHIKEYK